MIGYYAHLEELTRANTFFRHVLYTGPHHQLVLMSLLPNEEIGMEVHPDNDQFFRFESGDGKVIIAGVEYIVRDGDTAIVQAGQQHNVINMSSTESLKMYTIYAPKHHPDGTIHKTKADALAAESHE